MMLFYRAAIESMIRYGITTWYGNLSVDLKNQLLSLTNRAAKIIGMPPPSSIQGIFDETARRQGLKISGDQNHVLHSEFQLMPHGRRFRQLTWIHNPYRFSFILLAIKLLNKTM